MSNVSRCIESMPMLFGPLSLILFLFSILFTCDPSPQQTIPTAICIMQYAAHISITLYGATGGLQRKSSKNMLRELQNKTLARVKSNNKYSGVTKSIDLVLSNKVWYWKSLWALFFLSSTPTLSNKSGEKENGSKERD